MKERPTKPWRQAPGLRWAAWLACVLFSTALLVGPSLALYLRQQIGPREDTRLDLGIFLLSKTFHVSDYALMTILTVFLPASRRLRALLVLFLSLHAAGTEFFQLYVDGRVGTLHDVGLDHIGILLGLMLTWRRWGTATDPARVNPGAKPPVIIPEDRTPFTCPGAPLNRCQAG